MGAVTYPLQALKTRHHTTRHTALRDNRGNSRYQPSNRVSSQTSQSLQPAALPMPLKYHFPAAQLPRIVSRASWCYLS
jgi:hypothetical protein